MTFNIRRWIGYLALSAAPALVGQGTLADYQRAQELQAKARDLVVNSPGATSWIRMSRRTGTDASSAGFSIRCTPIDALPFTGLAMSGKFHFSASYRQSARSVRTVGNPFAHSHS